MSSPFTQRSLVRRRADRDRGGGGGGAQNILTYLRLDYGGLGQFCSAHVTLYLFSCLLIS